MSFVIPWAGQQQSRTCDKHYQKKEKIKKHHMNKILFRLSTTEFKINFRKLFRALRNMPKLCPL